MKGIVTWIHHLIVQKTKCVLKKWTLKVGVPSWIEYTKKRILCVCEDFSKLHEWILLKIWLAFELDDLLQYKKNRGEKFDLSAEIHRTKFRSSLKIDQYLDQSQIPSKIIGKLDNPNWFQNKKLIFCVHSLEKFRSMANVTHNSYVYHHHKQG